MRIIARSTLKEYWQKHPDTEKFLKAWFDDASCANWESPSDIKEIYANASIIANNRVVFNIKGNNYRLIVNIRYELGIIFIRFIGTHQEYDKIDATII
ncbi:type II toxin-antitoxin system HigB family toxin [Anabaena cylindrica UHCC 0172]|uniref:type II toxin-antitoxin system HigB family toxin n=1 Tax=Anabaena cylindrica TaxID=1165 RepID=UPI002B1FA5C1|nr:type II toxin-antitoxin system HigB family toxin [Anabaena cylindrica]MEA5554791.1 type II toxin-antitoxin system HigB family toxin [Anabaena cylindrica UHCC 0172]